MVVEENRDHAEFGRVVVGMFSQDNLRRIVDCLEAAYPSEGCGLILEQPDGVFRVHPVENLADKYHALDPKAYPRTGRDYYILNPIEFVRAEDRGERVAVVFHSHPDVGDYFSAEDIAAAVMPRDSEVEPLRPSYPGTDYLVVSVREGRAVHATLFRFDDEQEVFGAVAVFEEGELQGGQGQ